MAAQSILGRITAMARANIHAMLDQVEDPQQLLDQMVRDYTANIGEAENAVATTIGNLRLMEADAREATKTAADWQVKAQAASAKADQMRSAGSQAEADKFDDLARIAIGKQIAYETEASNYQPLIAEQTQVTEQLKQGVAQLRTKLEELRRKRDELVSRAKVSEARGRVQEATGNIDMLDPTSEISRFEEMVRREEARLKGHEELAASSIDKQFEQLAAGARDSEIEQRLAAMKSGPSGR
ncbi:PspA/IM30 family protein [Catellatospora sp. KI3]|uniref:PspA/IM30 family protein n=1 Tax=Catellatospora sp. KI3 TaxID=3041620 RepID=UPI0024826FD1|nr:PspA/IM30 family protein [Catellatospora sp. KI3]MDI1460450.1 PspA/IM30 family protein [Catellatospora sp. KI3]